jgi:hypothetical protein
VAAATPDFPAHHHVDRGRQHLRADDRHHDGRDEDEQHDLARLPWSEYQAERQAEQGERRHDRDRSPQEQEHPVQREPDGKRGRPEAEDTIHQPVGAARARNDGRRDRGL